MKHLLIIFLLCSSSLLAQTTRLPMKPAGAAATGGTKRIQLGTVSGTPPANAKRITFAGVPYTDGRFSFSLDTSSATSAGVYLLPDTVLVRTLWSGIRYPAGLNLGQWDGLNDQKQTVGPGSYIVLVQSNNVRADWEGVAGNTSFVLGNTASMHRGYQFIRKLVEVGSYIYFNQHYVEGSPPIGKFAKSAPQTKIEVLPYGTGSGTGSEHIATDGSRVYYTRYDHLGDQHKNRTWVAALTTSNDLAYSFSAGGSYAPKEAQPFPESTLGLITSDSVSNHTGGLAVQKTGNLLFVSYPAKNQIRVFNKLTGAQLTTITSLSQPRGLAIDASDNLWVISGTSTVARYAVASNTIGAANLTLSGLVAPLTVAVSIDGATVGVGDAGSSQQVKTFSTSGGSAGWVLGQAGGYSTTSTVANDRFYFSDLSGGVNEAGICWLTDGGLWVSDQGNYRLQHFDNTRTYVDNINYITASYTHAVDLNDKTRVFDQYLEYSIDYSKPLGQGWTLVRNWRNQSPAIYFRLDNARQNVDMFGVFSNVATLSNGRTYGWLKKYDSNYIQTLAELTPNGGVLRPIPSLTFTAPVNLRPDGSLNYTERSGATILWKRRALTGFDGSNNPVWAAAVTEASAPVTSLDPVDPTGFGDPRAGVRTASGKILMYQDVLTRKVGGVTYGLGYHLGAVKVGASNWQWRTAYSTGSPAYRGEYPTGGEYDSGNHADFRTGQQKGYGGGAVTVDGEDLADNYYGEFWKDSQTNKWHLRRSNGLLVLVFGPTSLDSPGSRNIPGMAGGVHNGTLVRYNGVLYIWHAEEGGYSGLHRWKLSNLASIKTQVALGVQAVATKSFLAKPVIGTDLLAGLNPNDTLDAPGFAGWTFTGPVDTTAEFGGSFWALKTGSLSYNPFASPDLRIQFRKNSNVTYYVNRPLGYTSPVTSWTVNSTLNLTGNNGNDRQITDATSGGWYADVLDNAGKIIVRFYVRRDDSVSPSQLYIYANSTAVAQSNEQGGALDKLATNQPLSIVRSAGGIQFSYAGYSASNLGVFDAGADNTRPTQLRLTFWNKDNSRDRYLDFQSLNSR